MNLLSTILWLPIAAAVACLIVPRGNAAIVKGIGLIASVATFIVSLTILPKLPLRTESGLTMVNVRFDMARGL